MTADLQRYSRHMVLPEMDVAGQQILLDSHVLIVGAGGLGCAAAQYLAAAGIGQISIADDDAVELSNLQRQVLHDHSDIGTAKVQSAAERLQRQNPDICIHPIQARMEGEALQNAVRDADLVIDGSDNFPTRFAVNAACISAKKPLVSGAAIRFEGQLSCFTPGRNNSPCYRCLYKEAGASQEACEDAGVLGPVVGVIGSLQAVEAIKLLTGIGSSLVGRLLIFNALELEWRELKLTRDPACPACA